MINFNYLRINIDTNTRDEINECNLASEGVTFEMAQNISINLSFPRTNNQSPSLRACVCVCVSHLEN